MESNGQGSAHVIVISDDEHAHRDPFSKNSKGTGSPAEALEKAKLKRRKAAQEEKEDEEAIKVLKKKLDDSSISKESVSHDCCIFRVPQVLKQVDMPAFVPLAISIGPFHHAGDGLRPMEEQKLIFLRSLLSRDCFKVGLRQLFEAVAPLEARIRRSYSETIKAQRTELIEMMVLDGCFIIELFLRTNPKFSQRNMPVPKLQAIKRDLFKVENQIPFFVLETLYGFGSKDSNLPNLISLALGCLRYPYYSNGKEPQVFISSWEPGVRHLLDLFCLSLSPGSDSKGDTKSSSEWIFSAKKFHQAAIGFKKGDAGDNLLDIKFDDKTGTIKIPTLTVANFNKLIFFNGVAFEQLYMHRSRHLTSYVTFMGTLANTREDVELLRGLSIIENHLGTDKEVVRFFNRMRKDLIIVTGSRYLSGVYAGVEGYRKKKRAIIYSNWAEMWDKYFSSPWAFISFLGALAALLLTAVQTHYSIHPSN